MCRRAFKSLCVFVYIWIHLETGKQASRGVETISECVRLGICIYDRYGEKKRDRERLRVGLEREKEKDRGRGRGEG